MSNLCLFAFVCVRVEKECHTVDGEPPAVLEYLYARPDGTSREISKRDRCLQHTDVLMTLLLYVVGRERT